MDQPHGTRGRKISDPTTPAQWSSIQEKLIKHELFTPHSAYFCLQRTSVSLAYGLLA